MREKLKQALFEAFEENLMKVTEETEIASLNMDSLDVVEMVMALETDLDVSFENKVEDAFYESETVKDLIDKLLTFM